MPTTAEIVADSVSPSGKRLTTMKLRYPRFIHAEFMTHRLFSRNASSSRAIPVNRLIADLRRDPAMPVYWGANQKGMQAGAELEPGDIERCKAAWLGGMESAIATAEALLEIGLHKQIANRVLEPWAHINVVVTATEWDNFFELRRHEDAQPEIKALADAMHEAMEESTPRLLHFGQWHLPFITPEEAERYSVRSRIRASVARCARVSYLTHEGQAPEFSVDLALYNRLVGSRPLHASPAEHQATPDYQSGSEWADKDLWGNFKGWRQYRKQLERETTL